MCLYITLRNINEINEICMYNDNNKHLGKIEKNTLDQHYSEWSVSH